MQQIKYNSGGQPFRNNDFATQQLEIYKAIENQLASTSGCVLSGVEVSGVSPNGQISAGLVYLDGKIREVNATTGLTFPFFIVALDTQSDSRIHVEDQIPKNVRETFGTQIVSIQPVLGQFIKVVAAGVDKRQTLVIRNEETNVFNVDGFTLNVNKVSYVEAFRGGSFVVGNTVTGTFISYTETADLLSEFNPATGEFIAQRAGIYLVTCYFTASAALTFTIQWSANGSSWNTVSQARYNETILTHTGVKQLSAGQRLRLIGQGITSSVTVSDVSLIITRIG